MTTDNRKDLPHTSAPNFLDRAREAIQEYMGTRGDPMNRGLTVRDLVATGMITTGAGFGSSPGYFPLGPGPAIDAPYILDRTPPPAPTGVAITPGLSSVFIEHDAPMYTNGHGHGQTQVWGVLVTAGDPLPVFSQAERVANFGGTIYAYPCEPSQTWRLWLCWESIDGGVSAPAGGTNGFEVVTGQDPKPLLDTLQGKITESQLHTHLGARVALIDGSMPGSVNQRISSEAMLRQDAFDQLSQQISMLTAGVAGSFDPGVMWHYEADQEGWTSGGAAMSWLRGQIVLTSSSVDPSFVSPDISVLGSKYTKVRVRVERKAGSGWQGTCYYKTSSHGYSESYKSTTPNPVPNVGDTAVVDFNMATLTAGGTDWLDSTITGVRLDFGTTPSDVFVVDWVAIGRDSPGASMATVMEERQARITGDQALASDMATLQAESNENTAAIQAEATARTSAVSALASQVTALQSTVTTNNTTVTAAIQQESAVRAQQTGDLFARYSVKLDVNGYVSGIGLLSTANTGAPTSSFAVRADSFYVANPTGPGIAPSMPFIVRTTATTVGGVSVPAGVYIQEAFIANGTITNAKIANLAVDDGKIASLAVSKLITGSVQVGATISSTGYVAGTSGWAIGGNGTAEFNDVVVRGGVFASYGVFSGTVYATGGTFTGSVTGSRFMTGGYTGYDWPGGGAGGSYIGPEGLLLGNYHSGRYFQVTAAGDIYSPGLSVDSNGAKFTGSVDLVGNAGSGRMTITNQRLEVYDSANRLRVRLGVW